MRRLFYVVLSFAVLGLLLVGWMGVMSETHPYTPGSPVYPLQVLAEQVRFSIEHTSVDRVYYAMEIFDRQAAALAKVQDSRKVERFALALSETVNIALQHISNSPYGEQENLLAELVQRVQRADVVISAIPTNPEMTNLTQLNQTIASLLSGQQPVLNTLQINSLIQGVVVPFLSSNYVHMSINLRGGHALLACDTCHSQGKYAQTQYQCDSCHNSPARTDSPQVMLSMAPVPDGILPSNPYPNHFEGECIDCHNVNSWNSIDFDHAQVVECDSCHASDVPAIEQSLYAAYIPNGVKIDAASDALSEHYAGPCLRCHNDTSSWSTVAFTHHSSEACEDCHTADTPVDHYTGDCLDCHQNTDDWLDTAHHNGYTDCASCHQDVLPTNHFNGQCYYCHFAGGWDEIVFDHTGYDECTTCHIAPGAHYTDQCARCHTTLSWYDVNIVHKDSDDCTSCHRSDIPEDHYPGNCSTCHNFDGWENASFDHNVLTAATCSGCHQKDAPAGHYDYECSRCHIPGSWEVQRFDHIDINECLSCHTDDTPNAHYDGLCSNCHTVTSWTSGIHFDHAGYTVCTDCHNTPEAHYAGSCTSCHTTGSWDDIIYVHDGSSDCTTCHSAPQQHYPDACIDCHETSTWTVYSVDHIVLPVDCTLCHAAPEEHYLNSCTTCHTTKNWDEINFNHSGYDNCTGCHTAPEGHWPGQCSSCHTTEDWSDVNFDHTDYTNCKTCHVRPDGHSRGQCSKCHNTESWEIADPIPTSDPLPGPAPIKTPIPPGLLPTPAPPLDH